MARHVCIVALLCALPVYARNVTISNVDPRIDDGGAIMDAHDGNIFLHTDGLYYWFAASYGNCKEPSGNSGCAGMAPGSCGFQLDHNVSLWTSADLQQWTPHGPVFQFSRELPSVQGIMFCPKVLFNGATKTWVLWINYILSSSFADSYYAVATAPAASGPWTVVNPQVKTLAYDDTGDFNLFRDDDGSAYIIYTAHIQGNYPALHQMSVERLTPSYTATEGAAGNSGFFGSSNVEAPALFKRGSVYYAVFGSCCCYCGSGSAVIVHTAASPLGPYATRNPISLPTTPTAGWGNRSSSNGRQQQLLQLQALTGVAEADVAPLSARDRLRAHLRAVRGITPDAAIPAQQTHIFVFQQQAPAGASAMWVGDRWQSAPDGVKGHDFTYWSPLAFGADGNVTAMAWQNNFTLSM